MGILYLCPTPIGNLDDITYRVLKVLKSVDFICAEDTRHSLKLLNHFGIEKPLISYHEHNKYSRLELILGRLNSGENAAVVTDAGTPAISDPGQELVQACINAKIEVVALPGASACITALSASGMDTNAFVFEGFLPQNKKLRDEILRRNKEETRTIIFYEAPHRLISTLKIFEEEFGNRKITIAKELTKLHEKYIYTTISDAILGFTGKTIKGEYVVLIEGLSKELIASRENAYYNELDIEVHMDMYLNKGYSEKEAMKLVAKDRGISKREIYAKIKGKK